VVKLKTRLYYCCDIHASNVCFKKALNVAKLDVYKANVIIVGGDLTGKRIIPMAKQANGDYTCNFLEKDHVLKTSEEVAEMQKLIENSGFYPRLTEPEEVEELRKNRPKFDELINQLILERMREWMKLADERLAGLKTQFYMLPGNDDNPECGNIIRSSKYVKNPENEVVVLDGVHEMISSGASNHTPWKTPGEYTEEQLESMLEGMVAVVKNVKNCVLNLHVPPYDSGLDVAPKLNEQLQPVLVGGEFMRVPVGSTAVRKIIEKYQPKLGLFGHIHESGGDTFIGKTLCVNPGSEYTEGILRGYVVDVDEKGIREFYRVEG
jgi:Icc-related predicted phosphoesterase